jgi:aspartate/methionine/tyrosine aminotransferase
LASATLGLFTESVIREMTRLSDKYGAVNLSQGMPDFFPSPNLIEAAVEAIRHGSNQYSPTWGLEGLREAVAAKVKDYNSIDADPERNVTITCGSTEALTATVFALTNPGDQIVVTDPFYENYVPNAVLANCKLTYVPFVGRDLLLDEEALKNAMASRPKLFILNTPNNPTGKVMSREQLKLIADLCEDAKSIAVTDEIYEHITYDGNKHVSLASLGNMLERTVTVSGASKTYSVTGWRVGWAVAEAKLTDAVRKVHDYFTISAPTPLQEALITALNFPSSYYDRLSKAYDRKRRMMMNILDEAGLRYFRPEGTYYILVTVPEQFKDGEEFTDHLLKKVGLAVLPLSSLYHNKELGRRKIRIAFCKTDTTLKEVNRRIKKLAERPKQKLRPKTAL